MCVQWAEQGEGMEGAGTGAGAGAGGSNIPYLDGQSDRDLGTYCNALHYSVLY